MKFMPSIFTRKTSFPAGKTTPIYPNLAPLVEHYQAFLIDAWGVLHDGVSVYPGALACLRLLRELDKRIVIISNAARRADTLIAAMAPLGITAELFDHLVSSGEETWRALRLRQDPWHAALGRSCYYLGPQRSRGVLDGLDLLCVTDLAQADFILNTGAEGDLGSVTRYETLLRQAASRRLPMLCANPDLVAVRGGRLGISAGAVAARYEELLPDGVRYHGKPHAAIYDVCFKLLDGIDRRRILAVGDALRTDIAGAVGAGIDSVLVAGGIHAHELGANVPDRDKLAALLLREGVAPTAVIPYLQK